MNTDCLENLNASHVNTTGQASAHAWKNSSQKCTNCKEPVITWDLYYLKQGNHQQSGKEHVSECSKCKEVGDCRLYHPRTK